MRPQVIVVATLFLNAGLFVVNLDVARLSGSRAVLVQAIYTVTDLIGSGLLLWGLYLSRRPADYQYPFGRGKERFFWAFVSIVVTFSVAGVIALITGIDQILDPQPISHIPEGLLVVGATLLTSLVGVGVTLRELRLGRQTLQSLLESANQGLKGIFYQDLVAIVGSVAAFAGLLVVDRTGLFAIDGWTAAVQGFLLIATGFVLTAESREYLIGRALSPGEVRKILALVEQDPSVAKVRGFQSMLLGPDDALVVLRVNFQNELTTDQIEAAVDHVSAALRNAFPGLRHIVIEPES
ncbi:MAG TPA: cation diffusion facilitator family transporter [Thermoplasmata archaeon]|nr:cation diffusion facilitator family transporter [Thermoplasmata archaeon]